MPSTIPSLLREARLRQGLTLKAMGQAVNLSHSMIASIESGTRDPKLGDVEAIAAVVGLEIGIAKRDEAPLSPDDAMLLRQFGELLRLVGPNEKEIWSLEIQTRLRQIHRSN